MYRAITTTTVLAIMLITSCNRANDPTFTGAEHEVKILTLNPGHFHAALVQKEMYPQVDPVVNIYAPNNPDAELHLNRIEGFNSREQDPTSWVSRTHLSESYLERMIIDKLGNVVVIAGNNSNKTEYIYRSVEGGLNVLSDKPMAIDSESFSRLKDAFEVAEKNNVLLYDIMTERYEITSRLQRDIARMESIFGTQLKGTPDEPAVVKESVHHLFKYVSGSVLQRPPWYFDVTQQGEGIIDVTTHLVDLIQWVCFPDVPLSYSSDVNVINAKRWPTQITKEQFMRVTGLNYIPSYLHNTIGEDSTLNIYTNGQMHYQLKSVNAKVSVTWDYQAPEGGGDTHYSLMRGSKSNLIVRQGSEQDYQPMLFIEPAPKSKDDNWANSVNDAFSSITEQYPGIELIPSGKGYMVDIPSHYRIGHEAHFARVTEKYLHFLVDGKLPDWEIPCMITKYYTTTRAFEMAQKKSNN